MKVSIKNTAVAALLFTTVVGMANGPKGPFGKKSFEVEKNLINVELDPVFTRKGQMILLNILNLDQEKVTIKVYDSEGRVVFKEIVKGELIIEKAFSFEEAYADKYTVVVIDNNQSFKERIEVK